MRVTQSMLSNNLLRDLNSSSVRQMKYQSQLESYRRIGRISDDPAGVARSMTTRNELAKLQQYVDNVEHGRDWLTMTETALYEMNEIIQRVYELALSAANDTKTLVERQAIGSEVQQLSDQFLTSLNTSFNGQFVFGGFNTMRAPFQRVEDLVEYNGYDLLYASGSTMDEQEEQIIEYEVAQGIRFPVSVSGLQITGVGDENIFNILDEFVYKLSTMEETDSSFGDVASKMKTFQEDVLAVLADVGGRENRLDMMLSRYAKDEINNEAVRSRIEDADVPEVITKFKMEESIYRSALSVGTRIIQPSLLDFMR